MPSPRHINSFKLVESRFFAGLSCFSELEERINALLTPQERGAAFEVFAEAYLATQRVPQAKEVWPIGTESLELRQRLVLPATDKGIDGLILAEDDQFTAYQVIVPPRSTDHSVERSWAVLRPRRPRAPAACFHQCLRGWRNGYRAGRLHGCARV